MEEYEKGKWGELAMQFKLYREGGPDEEISALDATKKSNMMTDSMARREKLRAESIAAAAKAGKGYRTFETPNQPENFGVPMTDGFGYC